MWEWIVGGLIVIAYSIGGFVIFQRTADPKTKRKVRNWAIGVGLAIFLLLIAALTLVEAVLERVT